MRCEMKLYLNNTYLFEESAKILKTGNDEKGAYVVLDKTIFYPQGGGQPCDIGTIGDLQVSAVKEVEDEVRHYVSGDLSNILAGQKVKLLIDEKRRILNARYHTASHFLANIVHELYPNLIATKGHAFPGEAYVEFQGSGKIDADVLTLEIQKAIDSAHELTIFDSTQEKFEQDFYKLPYEIPDGKNFRVMRVGLFPPIPCGGTHLKNTKEIGKFVIKKIKQGDNSIKIQFNLEI